jgi:hypothetical protein
MRDTLLQVRRLALNLNRYREVTAEWMAKPRDGFDARRIDAGFSCECARPSCRETITMTLAEYEAVRADPERFFVVPSDDHVFSDFETVVEARSRYFVVERRSAGDDHGSRRSAPPVTTGGPTACGQEA